MDATVSFAVVCALVALASQIYSIWNNHNKNVEDQKREKIELEKKLIKFDMKLDNVNTSLNVITKNDENISNEMKAISTDMIKFDEQMKAAWKKIDSHEERLNTIEKEMKA